MNVYSTISEAYLGTLADVFDNPDCVSAPRGQKVREKFDYQFSVINPKPEIIRTKDRERNAIIQDYSEKEFELYESGSRDVKDFEKISKFWSKLANPDGTVNSAYGFLIFKNKSHGHKEFGKELVPWQTIPRVSSYETKMWTPWEWAKQMLLDDKDTRQAILRFSLPEHFWKGNKDFTCTLHGVFSIRNDKLNLTINMRSNDLTLGLVYDLPWFVSLMYKMQEELRSTYPNLDIGRYTHQVHNIHIYDRDEEKIVKMLGRV